MSHLELLNKQAQVRRPGGSQGRLVVVSNRVPVPGSNGTPAAGGLAIALDSALKTRGGIWFGWSGKASLEAEPPMQVKDFGSISYAVCDLSRRDLDEFYHGFANRALWPICHYRLDLAEFSLRDAAGYFRVNELFARRLAKMLRPGDVVWIHDYHFMPMASFLRQMGCANKIGFFMHIPWPPADIATALPAFDRIVRSMTAYDLIGFQTGLDAANFSSCLGRANVGQTIGTNLCEAFGRRVQIEAMPISIDTDSFAVEARLAEKNMIVKRTKASLENRPLVIGVDRLDYSKGIEQRICAFSTFLERSPQALKSRVTMLQITPKSRSEVPEYAKMQRKVAEQAGNVNGKHGDVDWTPIRYINKPMSRSALAGLYRLAKVGLVTPLRDGMNLVAKEYAAAQAPDDPGVLILSQFAGAACELKSALIVNPYDIEATAAAIARAFAMPLDERKDRHAAMMAVLSSNTIEHWTTRFLEALGGQNEDCFDEVILPVSEEFAAQDRFIPPSSLWTRFGH